MKKLSGFTLIEVLLALFIMTAALYVLSDAQIRSVRRVMWNRDEVDRIFLIKKAWLQAFLNPNKKDESKPIIKDLKNPDVKIKTTQTKPTRSLLNKTQKDGEAKNIKDPLQMVTSEGEWQSGVFKEKITFVGFIYKKPEEKEDKK